MNREPFVAMPETFFQASNDPALLEFTNWRLRQDGENLKIHHSIEAGVKLAKRNGSLLFLFSFFFFSL
jgi:hypothetical protein